ncbi:Anthranilate 1,2-dioxygenase large subunit (plasmid) [Sulfitobacter sp. THAF37]|uniref:aromatic ring-hydroxylating dioxygenase subunit alpha n=1 Tax=Sulfitobacter sp. THAF37 TaxID=2587855 RepID=UPI001268AA61|nr:aromatic ring-hydroxylating dioxygenase subunit alpha [Sulfitobacter sp. THAF37]QFT61199.1 Anthranilate 1,2-dioxygenase large subunit [Sulfitobacter sp. THAF37]
MDRYRGNSQAIADLVKGHAVHRDVYVDREIFELEMEQLFPNCWVYIGHESQLKNTGDFITSKIGNQPVLASRHRDGQVYVLHNRCPHKGVKIASEPCGNTGKFFRCPYHAWSFKTDGSLLAIPLKKGYEGTGFDTDQAARGLTRIENVKIYRGLIFVRLAQEGLSFEEFFGDALSTIDNMADRSPEGELEVISQPIRYMHTCNWKMLVENQTDTCHPMVAHESSAGTAVNVWEREKDNFSETPMAVQLYAPFMSPYEFYEGAGIRVWPNGHGHTGVSGSIHQDYEDVDGYQAMMTEAYGKERAAEILGDIRHNTIYFPNIMVKGPVGILRNFIPLGVDKTLVESWVFRLKGAPDKLYERALMYNRFINAPTSIVGHDDLEMYERAQEGLHSNGNEWVNLRRLWEDDEPEETTEVVNGTSERQMRNQFYAWRKFMVQNMDQAVEAAE